MQAVPETLRRHRAVGTRASPGRTRGDESAGTAESRQGEVWSTGPRGQPRRSPAFVLDQRPIEVASSASRCTALRNAVRPRADHELCMPIAIIFSRSPRSSPPARERTVVAVRAASCTTSAGWKRFRRVGEHPCHGHQVCACDVDPASLAREPGPRASPVAPRAFARRALRTAAQSRGKRRLHSRSAAQRANTRPSARCDSMACGEPAQSPAARRRQDDRARVLRETARIVLRDTRAVGAAETSPAGSRARRARHRGQRTAMLVV